MDDENENKTPPDETAEEMARKLAEELYESLPQEEEKEDSKEEKEGEGSEDGEEGEEDEEAQADDAEKESVEDLSYQAYSGRIRGDDVEESTSLWLITFTDTMALMLTFFVLLYAMSIPKEDEWQELTGAVQRQFATFTSQAFSGGSQDTIEIEKLDYSRALDLGYLKSLLREQINKEVRLRDVELIQMSDRLVISMPSDLLFEAGQADINADGRRALFAIGGSLSRIRNKIEVVGHSDPDPVPEEGRFRSNWELSLARASATAAVLNNVGYRRDIEVKGLSSARYDEIQGQFDEQRRESLSRRVDVVVLKDDGSKRHFMNVGD